MNIPAQYLHFLNLVKSGKGESGFVRKRFAVDRTGHDKMSPAQRKADILRQEEEHHKRENPGRPYQPSSDSRVRNFDRSGFIQVHSPHEVDESQSSAVKEGIKGVKAKKERIANLPRLQKVAKQHNESIASGANHYYGKHTILHPGASSSSWKDTPVKEPKTGATDVAEEALDEYGQTTREPSTSQKFKAHRIAQDLLYGRASTDKKASEERAKKDADVPLGTKPKKSRLKVKRSKAKEESTPVSNPDSPNEGRPLQGSKEFKDPVGAKARVIKLLAGSSKRGGVRKKNKKEKEADLGIGPPLDRKIHDTAARAGYHRALEHVKHNAEDLDSETHGKIYQAAHRAIHNARGHSITDVDENGNRRQKGISKVHHVEGIGDVHVLHPEGHDNAEELGFKAAKNALKAHLAKKDKEVEEKDKVHTAQHDERPHASNDEDTSDWENTEDPRKDGTSKNAYPHPYSDPHIESGQAPDIVKVKHEARRPRLAARQAKREKNEYEPEFDIGGDDYVTPRKQEHIPGQLLPKPPHPAFHSDSRENKVVQTRRIKAPIVTKKSKEALVRALNNKGFNLMKSSKLNLLKSLINKGMTSQSFPMIGRVGAYNPSTAFENANRVPTTPANLFEGTASNMSKSDEYKHCMVHHSMYKSNSPGGCFRCNIEKSTRCGQCGESMVKSPAYGLHCAKCK